MSRYKYSNNVGTILIIDWSTGTYCVIKCTESTSGHYLKVGKWWIPFGKWNPTSYIFECGWDEAPHGFDVYNKLCKQ